MVAGVAGVVCTSVLRRPHARCCAGLGAALLIRGQRPWAAIPRSWPGLAWLWFRLPGVALLVLGSYRGSTGGGAAAGPPVLTFLFFLLKSLQVYPSSSAVPRVVPARCLARRRPLNTAAGLSAARPCYMLAALLCLSPARSLRRPPFPTRSPNSRESTGPVRAGGQRGCSLHSPSCRALDASTLPTTYPKRMTRISVN